MKIHLLVWSGPHRSKIVYGGYFDYQKASEVAAKTNKKRSIWHRMYGDMCRVETYEIYDAKKFLENTLDPKTLEFRKELVKEK